MKVRWSGSPENYFLSFILVNNKLIDIRMNNVVLNNLLCYLNHYYECVLCSVYTSGCSSGRVVVMDLLSNLNEKSWQNAEPEKLQGNVT